VPEQVEISVLNGIPAIHINILIMRTLTGLREILLTHKDLARKLTDVEKRYDSEFKVVFDAIRQLMATPASKMKVIKGFEEGWIVKQPGPFSHLGGPDFSRAPR
jgi:hypothetical protein